MSNALRAQRVKCLQSHADVQKDLIVQNLRSYQNATPETEERQAYEDARDFAGFSDTDSDNYKYRQLVKKVIKLDACPKLSNASTILRWIIGDGDLTVAWVRSAARSADTLIYPVKKWEELKGALATLKKQQRCAKNDSPFKVAKSVSIEDYTHPFALVDEMNKAARPAHQENWRKILYQEIESNNARLIKETDRYILAKITKRQGAIALGKKSKWCTAIENDDQYYKDHCNDLLWLYDRETGERFQLNFHTVNFMDENNKPISISDLTEIYDDHFYNAVSYFFSKAEIAHRVDNEGLLPVVSFVRLLAYYKVGAQLDFFDDDKVYEMEELLIDSFFYAMLETSSSAEQERATEKIKNDYPDFGNIFYDNLSVVVKYLWKTGFRTLNFKDALKEMQQYLSDTRTQQHFREDLLEEVLGKLHNEGDLVNFASVIIDTQNDRELITPIHTDSETLLYVALELIDDGCADTAVRFLQTLIRKKPDMFDFCSDSDLNILRNRGTARNLSQLLEKGIAYDRNVSVDYTRMQLGLG